MCVCEWVSECVSGLVSEEVSTCQSVATRAENKPFNELQITK